MSMAKCSFCSIIFDTDEDPESCCFIADKFVCETCREVSEEIADRDTGVTP